MSNALYASGSKDGTALSAQTIGHVRAVLRRAINQAVKWGVVSRNVATLVDMPQIAGHTIGPLSAAQAAAVLTAVSGHRLEVLYRVALSLGLRKGEVLGLRWADVAMEAGTLRVAQAIQRTSKGLTTSTPKTKQAARTLPLPAVLLNLLQRHKERQDEERAMLGAEWREHGLVFPSNVGTPIEPRNLSRHFKSVLKRIELPLATRFHDLRHSCATLLIAQGVHPRVVMEILGHSQISVTMNTYAHVLPESQRDAADKLDALFRAHDNEDVGEHI